jgi:hypothetical protein
VLIIAILLGVPGWSAFLSAKTQELERWLVIFEKWAGRDCEDIRSLMELRWSDFSLPE